MLKALVLHGFKSFAQKTRFEFPDGITVVVGPNGSGKSNVVDALKWALGEQSAKSLRGKEMADVIFKGAGNESRQPMNTAEVTVIFDNHEGRLPIEATEVSITRRIYRSGEGEYLINGQPCRMRDVKDMLRGTGVGADAYSVIEQGKVGSLLQSSAKDRRAIFEEAAGISRFKAKKLDSQRRLERVEMNLVRLSDIVDEVEGRLRTIRNQAGKARRYKEYTDRLQELRTQVGLTDWRKLSDRLNSLQQSLEQLSQQVAQAEADRQSTDQQRQSLEEELAQLDQQINQESEQLATNRETIAGTQAGADHQRQRLNDLTGRQQGARSKLLGLCHRATDLQQRAEEAATLLEGAHHSKESAHHLSETTQQELDQLNDALTLVRKRSEVRRDKQMPLLRQAAELSNRITSAESDLQSANTSAQRHQQRWNELQQTLAEHSTQQETCAQAEQSLSEEVQRNGQSLKEIRHQLKETQQDQGNTQRQLAERKGQLTGAEQRAALLEELERKQEGLSSGVRDALARRQSEPRGPFGDVCGLVADLVHVDVESAPLVEAALGDSAHYVVLDSPRVIQSIRDGDYQLPGRVGFLVLGAEPPSPVGPSLENEPGVIGLVESLIQVDPRHRRLISHLLQSTWVVEDLAVGLSLRQRHGDAVRLLTQRGELIQRDGSVIVGARKAAVGVISRRSQLRTLHQSIADAHQEIQQLESQLDTASRQAAELSAQVEEMGINHRTQLDSLAEHRANTRASRELCQQIQDQCDTAQDELRSAQERQTLASQSIQQSQSSLEEASSQLEELDRQQAADGNEIAQLEPQRQQLNRIATEAKVALAKAEQQLESLTAKRTQYQADHRECAQLRDESLAELHQSLEQIQLAERSQLQTTTQLADLYLDRDQFEQTITQQSKHRFSLASRRSELATQADRQRDQLQKFEREHHQQEMEASQLRLERSTLAERLRDDYGIELADLKQEESPHEQSEREATGQEIDDLRRKITNIGAVNMDALGELTDLESRFESLSTQHQDLVTAKESLEKIISKINADSRRMFGETLQEIRTNFQALFRRVFGGGRADIVLEEGVDPLEAGIEIMATPPGKNSLGISLLSGGEQALTAVTLLLGIFQFRPCPFCILDEVDGPLDEANIGRFTEILHEFLSWTKFVVVTHSKKTMTVANTLYGVTMQESGVSKRVSVQFDDVSEDGHIRSEAVARDDAQEAKDSNKNNDELGAA